jgi:periplasmic divalent cation tolerance protein
MSHPVVCFSTCASQEDAESLAQALVERRLAACVNIVPAVTSIYRWKGEVQRDQEVLLLIKTAREKLPEIRRAFKELHRYEVPELIALEIKEGIPAYLEWLMASVRPE